jgi:hypothetical protein
MATTYFKQIDLENSILPNDWLENKIKVITEDAIVKNFPDTNPTIEWASNVIDLLEFLGLDVY